MKILHLLNASDAGGLSRYVLDMAVATKAAGHEVAIAGDRGVWHERFQSAGLEWIEVPFNSGAMSIITAANLLRSHLKAKGNVDLFHSHYRKPTWTARFLQRMLPGKRPPILYTLHLSDLPMKGLNRWLSDFGDHTHVASSEAQEWMTTVARRDAKDVTLIPHGVEVARWPVTTVGARNRARREFKLGEKDRVLAYVGRLDQNHPKNAHWPLELLVREPEVKLLIAGDGPDRGRIEALIREKDLAGRVRLLGEVDPKPVYAAADLLLLPSGREGFSLVCAEAMATGLPVLRTRTAGTRGMIEENVTGRSVPVEEGAFVAAAREMIGEPANLREMGRAGAKLIRERFTFERQVRETLGLYGRLTGG